MSVAQPSTIDYDPKWTDYQDYVRDTLESGEYDLVVFRTGYGGGKSITGCQWVHLGGLQLDHGESLVMGQDFQKAEATTFKVFFETLPGENTVPNDARGDPENSPIVAGYNENKKRLTYVSGHVVRLGSADVWSRYAGGEFNRIYCDEVAHYDNTDLYDLHEMLVSRQRTEQGPNTMLWTSTGNGYEQFYDITERQVDEDDERLAWADSMHVVVASTEHNNLLPPDGLEKIKNQFEGTAREEQALHGGFAAAKGLVYQQFTRNTHVVPSDRAVEQVSGDWRLYGYDHGWDDPRVVIEIARTPADQYLILDLFYESETVVEDAIAWLEEHDKPRGRMFCEHEPDHIKKFQNAGYAAEKATKDIDSGIPVVRDRLECDSTDRSGLLVNEDCTDAIREFQSYKKEQVGKATAEDHCCDALRYALVGDAESDSGGGVYSIDM